MNDKQLKQLKDANIRLTLENAQLKGYIVRMQRIIRQAAEASNDLKVEDEKNDHLIRPVP
jgi:regulator of replication initiation timing